MKRYELEYSKFLADISQNVLEFIKNNYFIDDINKNNVYYEKNQKEIETQNFNTNNTFENVDNSKVKLVEYNKSSGFDFTSKKTLLYIVGAIIIWQLLKRR